MSEIGTDGWGNCSFDVEGFIESHQMGRHITRSLHGFNSETPYYLGLLCEADFIEAYRVCPPLKAIVGKRAKAFNNGVRDVYNKNTENLGRGREANMLREKLARPNVLQTGVQFFSQQNHYIDLFGYCPLLRVPVPGFVDEIKALWNIPPWLFDITYTRKWLDQFKITGIYKDFYLFWDGKKIEIDAKNLKFIFDDGIGSECDTNLTIPDSRLVGMDYIVSNIAAAYKSRNTLITKRGAIGILSNEGADSKGTPLTIDEEVRKDLQTDFKKYGIVGQPFQVIITDAKLKWQQMGFATKDLLLFEEIADNVDRLCDAYGWPPELISRPKQTTYDNRSEARIDLYHDTIMPEDRSRMEQFTNCVVSEGSNLEIKNDFTKVPVLQKELKEKAEARLALNKASEIEYRNGLLTKNEWRKELGKEEITDDETFNEYKEEVKPEEDGNNTASKDKGAPAKK